MDDEKIEQVTRQKGLLTEDQIEMVREAIREAAEQGEELSFFDAAVRLDLLTDLEAEEALKEAELEISTCETEDISGAIAGEPSAADEGDGNGQDEQAVASAAESDAGDEIPESEAVTDRHEVPEEQAVPAVQKPPYAAIAVGMVILIIFVILAAVFNR